jgi:hypothetical protein
MTLKTSRPSFSCTPRSVSISVATVCTHRLWIFTLVPVSSAQTTGEARSCSMIVSTTSASSRSSPQFLQVAGACVMVVLATRRTRCAPGDPGCLPWGSTRSRRTCLRPPLGPRLASCDRVRRRWLRGVLRVAAELGREPTDPVVQRPHFGFEFDDARIALPDDKLRGSELLSQLLIRELVIERDRSRAGIPTVRAPFPQMGDGVLKGGDWLRFSFENYPGRRSVQAPPSQYRRAPGVPSGSSYHPATGA